MGNLIKPLSQLTKIIFLIFLGYILYRLIIYHLALIAFPYPMTIREGAMMASTQALVKGLNPFAMELQPQITNQYGIGYPLLVWPWAKIFGVTLVVHRAVLGFFIAASSAIIFFVLRRLQVSKLLSLWASLMLYACLIKPATSTPSIDPGGVGMFFFLLTILIPWFCNYSYNSLVISILCGLAAFYTKPYFLLGVMTMSSFVFLFVSKRKGLFYGILLLAVALVSFFLVNTLLPAYFDNCIFTSINMAPEWESINRLHEQLVKYWEIHQWVLILLGLHWVWYMVKPSTNPIMKSPLLLFVYAAICSSLVLYFSLGRHYGAWLWYFFQLLSPFMLILAVWLFNRNSLWPLICVPFLIFTLFTFTIEHKPKMFNKNIPDWIQMNSALSNSKNVLNCSVISPLLIEQNKPVVDDGHSEYFLAGGERKYWLKGFKDDLRVYNQIIIYFSEIKTNVQNKKYDLIVLAPNLMPLGVGDVIKENYRYMGDVSLLAALDGRSYPVSVWIPN